MAPNPNQPFPLPNYNRLCFLKNIIKNPNIEVGDYTYYDDFDNVENFEKNVKYHFDFIGYNATILAGVTIGHGAIIAANTTVTKDVEPYRIIQLFQLI